MPQKISKLYGLIGYPLGHSFSKDYFTQKFQKEGLQDAAFEKFSIPNISLFPEIVKSNTNLKGLAVTIPYKETVMQYLDKISPMALEVGAVNCIKFSNGFSEGFNTDAFGFEKSFTKLLKPHHTHALVLGTGGAAKAVQYALQKLKIEYINISRKALGNAITYKDIDAKLLEKYKIIINCTPVGMQPNDADCPKIPYEYLTSDHYLFDLIYKPAETQFLRLGKEKGATVLNGYDMLIYQAEENWKIWNA